MRKLTIAFLILMVLLQCGMKTAIVTHYRINKEYIAANLCENKANKSMHCEGKCYLSKKMKAQEEQEKRIPSILKGLEEMILFCSSFDFLLKTPSSVFHAFLNNIYFLRQYDSPALTIFQPPQ